MYLPFSHLNKFPKSANFELFRQSISNFYSLINRLTSGKTYVDTFSPQSIFTPIDIHDSSVIGTNLRYTSGDQVPTIANNTEIVSVGADYSLNLSSPHRYVRGMPIRYNQTGGTHLGSLYDNRTYWVKSVTSGTSITLSEKYNGDILTVSTSSGTHTLSPSYPMMQIDEKFFNPINNSLENPVEGVLAYGDVNGTKSTLYYYNGSAFTPVKLGWGGGVGYYNNEGTTPQKYTGWCNGNGHYRIVAASNQIKIQFDWIQVVEDVTGNKDIVTGVRTTPVSDYNTLIINTSAGVNSIDSGIILSNTGYYVYLVYNPVTQTYGGILSLNADKPNFPIDETTGSYYSSYQRLGWIKTDDAGNFMPSLQVNDKFSFFDDPGVVATSNFYGSGTSVNADWIVQNISDSAFYPRVNYLDSVDLSISLSGTGVNSDNKREIYLNGIPEYVFNPRTSHSQSNCHVINEYKLNGETVVFAIYQNQVTDHTALNFRNIGFRFNKGELHV